MIVDSFHRSGTGSVFIKKSQWSVAYCLLPASDQRRSIAAFSANSKRIDWVTAGSTLSPNNNSRLHNKTRARGLLVISNYILFSGAARGVRRNYSRRVGSEFTF